MLEQHILHVLGECKLEHMWHMPYALLALAASAPLPLGDLLIFGELKKGMEEPIHCFLDDLHLDLVIQAVQ